mmetsp:Transcript_62661/g.167955  ORF Transcript_62661/g.167955 Transcript_62661/m.167955 type:complete len:281 (+) Transcript_62661:59-901(+)
MVNVQFVCSLRAVKGHGTVEALASCLKDESALLRHEIAYALGQKEDISALPILIQTLRDDKDPMVRHEAAEAIGAIGEPASLSILEEFEHCDVEEVAHTCQLALDRIRWKSENKDSGDAERKKYSTIDPAPAADRSLSVQDHVNCLLDSKAPLFKRYGSLFALRDIATDDAVLGLSRVLSEDRTSALMRHEIAFVLGQLQNKQAVSALESCLRDTCENQMVRHEAAEAVGAVLGEGERCRALLEEYARDSNQVVAESCLVALDVSDYWADDAQLHYAPLA